MNLHSEVINGKLHVTCCDCEETLIPYDGPYSCPACLEVRRAKSLAHPSQWHPDGPLYVHHGAARFALDT